MRLMNCIVFTVIITSCARTETPPDSHPIREAGPDTDTDVEVDTDTELPVAPVRALVLVDKSASNQCTDASRDRLAEIRERFSDLIDDGAKVGYVSYTNMVSTGGFTTDLDDLAPLLLPDDGAASDLQGAIATARVFVANDIASLNEAVAPYTKYVVIAVTGGMPEPACTAGCVGPEIYAICEFEPANIPPGQYVDYPTDCSGYNLESSLSTRIAELVDLPGAGEITFHIRTPTDPMAELDALCGIGNLIQNELVVSAALYAPLATVGNGTYLESEPDDPFLDDINFDPLPMP